MPAYIAPPTQQSILDVVQSMDPAAWQRLQALATGADQDAIQRAFAAQQQYDPAGAAVRTGSDAWLQAENERALNPEAAASGAMGRRAIAGMQFTPQKTDAMQANLDQMAAADLAAGGNLTPDAQNEILRGALGSMGGQGALTAGTAARELGISAENIRNQRRAAAQGTQQASLATQSGYSGLLSADIGRRATGAQVGLGDENQDIFRKNAAATAGQVRGQLPKVGLGSADLLSSLGNKAAATNATAQGNYAAQVNAAQNSVLGGW